MMLVLVESKWKREQMRGTGSELYMWRHREFYTWEIPTVKVLISKFFTQVFIFRFLEKALGSGL